MPFPLIPIAILGLVGTAGVVQAKRKKAETDPAIAAQRQVIYETAIGAVDSNTAIKDPVKLRELAAVFRSQGLVAEAEMLTKRAALRELPPEVVQARREAFRAAMASTDATKVMGMADAYESQGCTGAAADLRKYAAGLLAAEESNDEQA